MKKPSSKIREEIARLQDQLRAAETREAELQAAFEEIAGRFHGGKGPTTGKENGRGEKPDRDARPSLASGADAGGPGEA
ncbi:TraC family protein [Agrobacterium vitis]|uniref:TraC family protein n=1 Tax=Agrobacterium vitis TaxID=373 RepID=A0AAE2UPS0_AGRVI|nr:TraC family protein [Agrobacterium vitis]MBF2714227.1 TraC family protein [Agrobacterium vitis]